MDDRSRVSGAARYVRRATGAALLAFAVMAPAKVYLLATQFTLIRENLFYPWQFSFHRLLGVADFVFFDLALYAAYGAIVYAVARRMRRTVGVAAGLALLPLAGYLLVVAPIRKDVTAVHWVHVLSNLPAFFLLDLGVAVAFGAIAALIGPRLPRRLFVGAGLAMLWLVAVANVYLFEYTGTPLGPQHLRLAEKVGDTTSSLASVADGRILVFALAAAVLAGAVMALQRRRERLSPARGGRRAAPLALASVAVLVIGANGAGFLVSHPGSVGLEDSPAATFAAALVPEAAPWRSANAHTTPVALSTLNRFGFGVEPPTGTYAALAEAGYPVERVARGRGMNVVLIVLESTGITYFQPYHPEYQTAPFMTSLLAHGALVSDQYTSVTHSMASLFSIFCSSVQLRNQGFTYDVADFQCRTLPEILKDQGYRTALVHTGRFAFSHKLAFFRNRGFDYLADTAVLNPAGKFQESSWGVEEQAGVDAALDWIAQAKDAPFFLSYISLYPHSPYELPQGQPSAFGDATPLDAYESSLHYMDSMLQRLVEGMDRLGVRKDTLFVIVGDHGEAFGEHQNNFGHIGALYEEAVRVPLLLISDRLFDRTVRIQRVGSAIDITPTVLDLLGLPVPRQHEGVSLVSAPDDRAVFFRGGVRDQEGIRDGPWKYFRSRDYANDEHLYYLPDDPTERNNQVRARPEVAAAMRARLDQWHDAHQGLSNHYNDYVRAMAAGPPSGPG